MLQFFTVVCIARAVGILFLLYISEMWSWWWLSRTAETFSFVDYYNKVLCVYGLCSWSGTDFLSLHKLAIYPLPKLPTEQVRHKRGRGSTVHVNFSDTGHFNKMIQWFLSFPVTSHEVSFHPYFDREAEMSSRWISRSLSPKEIPSYSFLRRTAGILNADFSISEYPTGNRTRNAPFCGLVPQTTTPPSRPMMQHTLHIILPKSRISHVLRMARGI